MQVQIGRVTHYFSRLGVAGVRIESDVLKVGDTIHIEGHTTDVTQVVGSMQVEHAPVREARPGDEIGLQVVDHVREHDLVFKVLPEE